MLFECEAVGNLPEQFQVLRSMEQLEVDGLDVGDGHVGLRPFPVLLVAWQQSIAFLTALSGFVLEVETHDEVNVAPVVSLYEARREGVGDDVAPPVHLVAYLVEGNEASPLIAILGTAGKAVDDHY